ncbi:MAG: YggS family pyridoxal phosphate-dependent enzyme [Bacteroidia bacterium]|nr:YggS family pyridoxal phosphate-dependent enzyme [Bacteroidia bacterium]
MSAIKENINRILESLPADVKLVVVSKTRPSEDIIEAHKTGQFIFGENRAQEMAKKHAEINFPLEWHMIGHLQTNKIKYIVPFVTLIQSVDSFKLLKEINKEAEKNNRIISCLLQVYIAKEESKFGFNEDELIEMLNSSEFQDLSFVKIRGLMGMATFSNDESLTRKEFKSLKTIFDNIKSSFYITDPDFCEISMGMSGDYKIAIEEGSTMVRIGSSIFGERQYLKK